MNQTRVPRSVAALIFAVVGWSWLHSHLAGDALPQQRIGLAQAPTQSQKSTTAKAADGATRMIAGRALDALGRPVAGATVWLTREERSELDISEPAVIAQAQTQPDGRFELAALVSQTKQRADDVLREFEIWICSPGFAVAHASYFDEEPPSLSVSMVSQSPLTIRLRRPDGAPCAAATVTPVFMHVAPDHARLPKPVQERLRTRAAADGRVEVPGYSGGRVGVTIETEEFGVQTANLWPSERDPAVVALRGTRSVEGRLILPKGEKADLSRLRLVLLEISREEDKASPVDWQDPCEAQPDREGRFAFSKLPDSRHGTLHLHLAGLDALGLADDRDSQCGLDELPVGTTLRLEVPVRKGAWVTWLARDAYTKRPLAGVPVTMTSSNEFKCGGRTDENGHLRVCLCPGETYRLDCELPDGYLRTLFGPDAYVEIPTGTATCELPPIEFVRACPIEGQAVDAAGRPLASVRVRATWQTCETKLGKKPADVTQWATTDSAGHFRIEQAEAGASVTLTAARAGVLLATPIQIVAGDAKSVRLQEQKRDLVALSGRILGSGRRPIAGVPIVVEVADSPDPLGTFRTTVDADGSFRTPCQFPKQLKYRLTVRSLLQDVASSEWLCPAASGSRFPDLAVDSSKISVRSKLSGQEIIARVNGQPIYASELLERASTEPLAANGVSLLAASKELADGRVTEEQFRSQQEVAINKYLGEYIRTRLLAQAFQASLDASQVRSVEESIGKEFDNYVEKLKRDLNVTSRHEVDLKLGEEGTSLAGLRAEFRHRLLANEYLRGGAQQRRIERGQLLAYYRAHRDAYATSEKVTWQLIEANFSKPLLKSDSTIFTQTDKESGCDKLYRHRDFELALVGNQSQPSAASPKHSSGATPKDSLINSSAFNDAPNPESAAERGESKASPIFAEESEPKSHTTHSPHKSDEYVGSDKARETVNRVLEQLRKGEPFETVVKKFSDGPNADQGGWQPPTKPQSVADEKTAAALQRLAEGETSPLIETDHSFRIVRVVSRIPAGRTPFEEVEKSIREALNGDLQKNALDDLYSRTTIESAYATDLPCRLLPSQASASTSSDESTP